MEMDVLLSSSSHSHSRTTAIRASTHVFPLPRPRQVPTSTFIRGYTCPRMHAHVILPRWPCFCDDRYTVEGIHICAGDTTESQQRQDMHLAQASARLCIVGETGACAWWQRRIESGFINDWQRELLR